MNSPFNTDCEKNWQFFTNRNELNLVYKWSPLTVLNLQGQIIQNTRQEHEFLKYLRGSSNGLKLPIDSSLSSIPSKSQLEPNKNIEEWLFLCHMVRYSNTEDVIRTYYHILLRCHLINGQLVIKNWSKLFKFSKASIEFATGLSFIQGDPEHLLISYSTFDSTSNLIKVPFSWFC